MERALDATDEAARTVCVGPEVPTSRAVTWARERPTGGGPVAALAAGLRHVQNGVVVVLAVDHPFVTRDHVRLLASKAEPAALIVDENGRAQPLVAAYAVGELSRRLATIGAPESVPMHRLIDGMPLVTIEDARAARDCDTWDAVEWARSESRSGDD